MNKAPLFRSHLDLSKLFLRQYLKPGLFAIDATCGNGNDSLFIAEAILTENSGRLICFDVQKQAIESTRTLLETNLTKPLVKRITYRHETHENIDIDCANCDLVIYNLGYLPRSDKKIITEPNSTVSSITKALKSLRLGGIISITLYTGHPGGSEERRAIFDLLKEKVSTKQYGVSHHEFPLKPHSPTLLLIQKLK